MGYRNPVITLRFPELAEEGDNVYVVIRNPKLVPISEMQALSTSTGRLSDAEKARMAAARAAIEAGQDPGDLLTEDDANRGFALVARLVIGWRVWDATVPVKLAEDGSLIEDEETAPRLLPLPATPELVGRVPSAILNKIMDEVNRANPQRPTAPQEAGTSRTS